MRKKKDIGLYVSATWLNFLSYIMRQKAGKHEMVCPQNVKRVTGHLHFQPMTWYPMTRIIQAFKKYLLSQAHNNPAVLCAACRSCIGCDGHRETKSFCRKPFFRNPFLDKIIQYCVCPFWLSASLTFAVPTLSVCPSICNFTASFSFRSFTTSLSAG